MSFWKIALRGLRQRSLSTSLTALSMALGVMLIVAVLVVYGVVSEAFQKNANLGYDMIIGAKGGKLQLVLNTVYHLSTPIENIPYTFYKEIKEGEFASYVEEAIPYCLGDQYEGHRVVGTVPELFEGFGSGSSGMAGVEFADGRNFEIERPFEAVIGSVVSSSTGLGVGDSFQPTHGVVDDEQGHEHDEFEVVGVLKPTGTPNDRALFINIEGFYLLEGHAKPAESGGSNTHDHAAHDHDAHEDEHEGHDHAAHDHDHGVEQSLDDHDEHADGDNTHLHGGGESHEGHAHDADHAGHAREKEHDHAHEEEDGQAHEDEHGHDHGHGHGHERLPDEQREVTAILVRSSEPLAAMMLPNQINEGQIAQAVSPIREIRALFDEIVGPIELILLSLAVLVVIVASVGILVSLINSMSERRREIAIMRSLGARRGDILTIVLLESVLLGLIGGVSGWILGHSLVGLIGPLTEAKTGIAVSAFSFAIQELAIIPGVIVLALLAGYLPARMAYRTDVAQSLSATV